MTKESKFEMAHPEGFEPPTNRFVAEYSIQLSHGCAMAVREGFEPSMRFWAHAPLAGEYFRPLSHLTKHALYDSV